METWIKRETVYDGRIFRVESGVAQLEDGLEVRRDVIVHPGAVAVAPFLDGHAILVRQYRIAIQRAMLEIPAGKLEPRDTPERRAQHELAEEIGYVAGRLIPAGCVYPSVGILDERQYIFLGLDLTPEDRDADGDERIEVVHMPIDEVRRNLRTHSFEDAKTVIGLRALVDHLDTQ